MTNKNVTKRALLTSVLAIVVCITMLIGSTFAWFTDTASTSVNKIQSGNLDVQLVKEDGVQLTQRAYASAENVQSYKALIARGVQVTAQFVPGDKPVSVADLI